MKPKTNDEAQRLHSLVSKFIEDLEAIYADRDKSGRNKIPYVLDQISTAFAFYAASHLVPQAISSLMGLFEMRLLNGFGIREEIVKESHNEQNS